MLSLYDYMIRDHVQDVAWCSMPAPQERENFEHNTIVELEFNRVLFGLKPSPFLLNGTLRKHIRKYDDEKTKITSELRRTFHFDDLISGKDTKHY